MSNTLINITSLKQNYQTYLQAQNSSINAFAKSSFWDIDAGAMASILFDLYMNLEIIANTILPQYSAGDKTDQWLYSRGLPARQNPSYGTVSVVLSTPAVSSGSPLTIPINTVFIDSLSQNQYQTLQEITLTSNTTEFGLYALTAGNTQFETVGATLTNSSLNAAVTVQSCSIGATLETDQQCITRILQAILSPLAGARATDYAAYCLVAEPDVVTDSIIIPAIFAVNNVNLLGVFPLVGSQITDWQLDQSLLSTTTYLPYSRRANIDVMNTITTYIQNERLVGLTPVIGYCATHVVPALTASVSLSTGYSLSDNITINSQNQNGSPNTITITIQELIQREVRRAVCQQPYGGTIINSVNYITIESLITAVTNQLSATNGAIAQVLTNLSFNVTDIIVPSANDYIISSTPYIAYVYDFASYNSITVTAI